MDKIHNTTHLCDARDCCFLIIDVQEKLTAAIPHKVITRLRDNVSILLSASHALSVPVITTAQYPKGLGTVESFIINNLDETDKPFEKTCFSCLGADGFAEHLTQLGKKQVLLTGIEAHICVMQTALELQANDYDVFVVTDAIASRKLSSYDSAIKRLQIDGVQLLTTEAVLFEWLRDASHPEFRSLSRLIL